MRSLSAVITLLLVLAAPVAAHPCYRIVVDRAGHVFLMDVPGRKIIRIAPDGTWQDWLEFEKIGIDNDPHALALDADGRLHVAETYGLRIWVVTEKGKAELHPLVETLKPDRGVVQDLLFAPDGRMHLLFREQLKRTGNGARARYRLVRLEGDGRFTELLDILETEANLYPATFTFDRRGSVVFAVDNRLARVEEGRLVTLAGARTEGKTDGEALAARFRAPFGLALEDGGGLLVAEETGRRIRRLRTDGRVETVAGTGKRGNEDGKALEASFQSPLHIALRPDGALVIVDLLPVAGEAPRYHVRLLAEGQVKTLARVPVGIRAAEVKKAKEPASAGPEPGSGTSGDRRDGR